MKKIIAMAVTSAVFFVIGLQAAVAVDPVVINCVFLGNCKVYVSAGYDDSVTPSDGSISHPYKKITDAITKYKATTSYDGIYVAAGTYSSETLPWVFDSGIGDRAIHLKGGFKSDFSAEAPDSYKTYIKANSANRVMTWTDVAGTISGFDISGVDGGMGSSAISVSNTGATAKAVTITNNKIHDNTTIFGTTGVNVNTSGANTAVVSNNTFYGNTDALGLVMNLKGNIEAKNNVAYANSVLSVLDCSNGARVYNSYFLSNTVSYVASLIGTCTFQHNTVAYNTVNAGADYAAVVLKNGGNLASSNLITNNSGNVSLSHFGSDTSTSEYNAFYSNTSDPSMSAGNLVCDPVYSAGVNKTKPDDVKLGASSACVDKGKTISGLISDYYGNARPLDGNGDGTSVSDPGAYESPTASVSAPMITGLGVTVTPFSPNADGSQDSTTVTFTLNTTASVTVKVDNISNVTMKTLLSSQTKDAGVVNVVWDGKESGNTVVADGIYKVVVEATNSAGTDSETTSVKVDTTKPTGNECAGFTDVLKTDSICPALEYVVSEGIFEGYPDGTFQPNKIINRVETTKVTLIGFNKNILADDGSDQGFKDVIIGEWYMPFVRTAKSLNVLQGYPDGTLKPDQQINRVEMLKVFFNTSGDDLSGITVTTAPYVDTPISSSTNWYLKYVQFCKDHALMNVSVEGEFYPAEGMLRGDVAELFYRYHEAGL